MVGDPILIKSFVFTQLEVGTIENVVVAIVPIVEMSQAFASRSGAVLGPRHAA